MDITMFWLISILLDSFVLMSLSSPTYFCHKGTYLLTPLSGPEVCPPCTEGKNFMPEDQHRNKGCITCTQIQDPQVEILVKECNRTHNTEILCKTGFYRRKARNGRQTDKCVKCNECENPTLLCHGYHDTVCCGHSVFDSVLNKDGVYICQEKSVVCKQGEYFSKTTEQCLACPPNTYMSETAHNNTECKLCQTVTSYTHRIVQACNSTHPAVFDCDHGYFRNSSKISLSEEICSRCQTCHFVGRECDLDHDAVCCNSSNMIVSDTDTGPVCAKRVTAETTTVTAMKVCGECEYSYTGIGNNSASCHPCPESIYSDDFYHTNPTCKNCLQIKGRQMITNTSIDWSITKIAQCFVSIVCVLLIIVGFAIFVVKHRKIILSNKLNKRLTILMFGLMLLFTATYLLLVLLPEHIITVIFNVIFIVWFVVAFMFMSRKLQLNSYKYDSPGLHGMPMLGVQVIPQPPCGADWRLILGTQANRCNGKGQDGVP